MKGFIKKLTLTLLIGISTNLFAQTWQSQLTQLLNHELPSVEKGIVVMNAKTGKLLYERNANLAFTPASSLKVFTAAAAIDYLGPDYQFTTKLSYNPKKLHGGILRGNVYLEFTGDPSLKIKDLKKILSVLTKKGIKQINGNIILNNKRFRAPYYAPGWTQDSVPWGFSAPITTIILNQNRVYLKLLPSKTIGRRVKVKSGKYMKYMNLLHYIQTVSYKEGLHNCSLTITTNDRNRIRLGGCWPVGVPGWQAFSIKHPTLFAMRVIRGILAEKNIRFKGQVLTGYKPKSIKTIYTYRSKKLRELLYKVLKDSNNVYTESITKALGYRRSGRGTFLEGSNAIKAIDGYLTDIDFDKTRIVDGSGQSRYDLITPHQMVRLLHVIYLNKKLKKYILRTLPISGVDGTLKYRMTSLDMRGKVKAKTGSMTGVSSLSGYLTTNNHQTLIFTMIMNHIVGKVKPARRLQDELCEVLVRQ